MNISTRFNDIEVSRKSYSEDYSLVIMLYDTDDNLYELNHHLNGLIDSRVDGRQDITQAVIQEATDEALDHDFDKDIDRIKSIDVIAEQKIRMTPYDIRSQD